MKPLKKLKTRFLDTLKKIDFSSKIKNLLEKRRLIEAKRCAKAEITFRRFASMRLANTIY